MLENTTIQDFEKKLNNRSSFEYKKMFFFAHKWADERNSKNNGSVIWSWDCGLKLDFDGDLVSVSSRFYPPHKSHADFGKYYGSVNVRIVEKDIYKKEFEADTLSELCTNVENFVMNISEEIEKSILLIFNNK